MICKWVGVVVFQKHFLCGHWKFMYCHMSCNITLFFFYIFSWAILITSCRLDLAATGKFRSLPHPPPLPLPPPPPPHPPTPQHLVPSQEPGRRSVNTCSLGCHGVRAKSKPFAIQHTLDICEGFIFKSLLILPLQGPLLQLISPIKCTQVWQNN